MRCLLDVVPVLSGDNVPDASLGHAIDAGYLVVVEAGRPVEIANVLHLSFGEDVLPISLSSRVSPLLNLVRNVIGVRTKEQMARVDAWGIVAAMEDEHPFGDRAACHLPGDAMRSLV
jgi:hypothetical protein